jgi:hypothetical protein
MALRFMGHKIGLQQAFIIESLSQTICAAAFVMPASLGAQEAAYMTIGMLLGVPPAFGLAVSLAQRLKDVSASILGLLLWQGFEGRRLWAQWKKRQGRSGMKS